MNDRYLFKAKRIDNGEWVQGSLFERNLSTYIALSVLINPIISSETNTIVVEVNKNTICQCTGLNDKNGKLIWENDIVRDEHGNFYKAIWQSNYYQFSWVCVKSEIFQIGTKWDLWRFKSSEIEVVGNIFDNPELLESEG